MGVMEKRAATRPWAELTGARIITAAVAGTVLFAVTAVVAAIVGNAALWPAFVVALALFGAGCVAFVVAFAAAAERSRRDEMGIGGLFFLAGKETAPTAVKWWLLGSFTAQIVVAIATAAVRPFSTLAFGVLAPLYGVALCGLWAARYGRFGPRRQGPERRPSARRDTAGAAAVVEASPQRGKNASHE
jgi:MFS family permease